MTNKHLVVLRDYNDRYNDLEFIVESTDNTETDLLDYFKNNFDFYIETTYGRAESFSGNDFCVETFKLLDVIPTIKVCELPRV